MLTGDRATEGVCSRFQANRPESDGTRGIHSRSIKFKYAADMFPINGGLNLTEVSGASGKHLEGVVAVGGRDESPLHPTFWRARAVRLSATTPAFAATPRIHRLRNDVGVAALRRCQ